MHSRSALIPSPSLSFVIPAYNAGSTLARTLASLQGQTRPDWQAIVVDDGSCDATQSVAYAAAAKDPRISLHEIVHSGVSKARNFGLVKADAEWVCFLDADDWVRRDFCQVMLDAVRPDVDLIYCGHQRIAPDGGTIPLFSREFETRGFEHAARECPTAIHAVIVRKNLISALQAAHPALTTSEHWDQWPQATRPGGPA